MSKIFELKEQMEGELADIMLLALRKEAAMHLTNDEYYKRKEQLMQVVAQWILP